MGLKHARRARQAVIAPCMYCGQPFARQMHDGVYCNEVCRYQDREQKATDGNPGMLTVEQLADAVNNEATE